MAQKLYLFRSFFILFDVKTEFIKALFRDIKPLHAMSKSVLNSKAKKRSVYSML